MPSLRNWNPVIDKAVAHITETQWNTPLPMREIDPPMLRARINQMPGGQGITAQPHGYAAGTDPLSFWSGNRPGKQRQRPNGQRPVGGPTIINTGDIGNSTTNIGAAAAAGPAAGALAIGAGDPVDNHHDLYGVRSSQPRNFSRQIGYNQPALGNNQRAIETTGRALPWGPPSLPAGGLAITGPRAF